MKSILSTVLFSMALLIGCNKKPYSTEDVQKEEARPRKSDTGLVRDMKKHEQVLKNGDENHPTPDVQGFDH